jgi:mannose-6-phosphate isomerase-like protein (cupin superfamily)
MFITSLESCEVFTSADKAILREILHPDKAPLKIRYSLAHATVRPGATSLPHRLKTAEVYYIMAGEGMMFIDAEQAAVKAGDTVYIPPGSRQHIKNTGAADLLFLCIVDPAWRAEDEEVL